MAENNKACLQETEWNGVYLVNMAQDMDKWNVLVTALMNFWAPHKAEAGPSGRAV